MNLKPTTRALLALVAFGSLLSAQTPAKSPDKKPGEASPQAQTPPAKKETDKKLGEAERTVTNATAASAAEGIPFTFEVTGLSKDNIEQVRVGLSGLTTPVFICGPDKVEQVEPGTCPTC